MRNCPDMPDVALIRRSTGVWMICDEITEEYKYGMVSHCPWCGVELDGPEEHKPAPSEDQG